MKLNHALHCPHRCQPPRSKLREIFIKNEGELTKMREILHNCKLWPFLHCFLSLATWYVHQRWNANRRSNILMMLWIWISSIILISCCRLYCIVAFSPCMFLVNCTRKQPCSFCSPFWFKFAEKSFLFWRSFCRTRYRTFSFIPPRSRMNKTNPNFVL